MDILKRNSAPITEKAWEEIDDTAKEAITSMLTARRLLKVDGPKGFEFNCIGEGRLKELDSKKGEVGTAIYEVRPLVESRIVFELNKWELDDIERGIKDPKLDALEEACKKIALFEEDAIYNGYKKGNIEGLIPSAGHSFKLGNDGKSIIKAISDAKYALFESYTDMPYDLVVSADVHDKINQIYEGVSVYSIIKKIIGGEIYRSKVVKGAVMFPHKCEDIEFTVGGDFSVGYEYDDDKMVRLFVGESFMLRVLDPDKIAKFE
ncbi:family 1 encapsulin nanocompartment shell protein [Peptoniphilus obesi]|uniref:family 1 encapsulin nanocompartment shell protein n=1 Tax=Peptoniphilus obesi TaxID=1472765 RepID=UPI0004B967DF|nr:family 1 encapsulin nanocompartment shell protein [Peptoniphilus obesi]